MMDLLNPLKLYKLNLKIISSENIRNPVNKSYNMSFLLRIQRIIPLAPKGVLAHGSAHA